ncbi:MAG: hypothetical protein HYW48_00120 [Deltaproteobacteria bacterium]|nr:hypothetical protein [Deltaproteobacteria bacterium]
MRKFLISLVCSAILSACGQEKVQTFLAFLTEETSQYPSLDFSDPKKPYLNQAGTTFYVFSYKKVATILFLREHIELVSEKGETKCNLSIDVRLSDSYYVNLGDCEGNGPLRLRIKDSFWEQFRPKPQAGDGAGGTTEGTVALVADSPQELLSPPIIIDNIKPTLAIVDPSKTSINSDDEISFALRYGDETFLASVLFEESQLSLQTEEGTIECLPYDDTQSVFKIDTTDVENPRVSIHACEGNGTFKLAVAGGAATDGATNADEGAVSGLITVDNTNPTLTVISSANEQAYTKLRDILYRFLFSQSVSGFTKDDVNVVNGTKGEFSTVSDKEYTLTVSADAEGEVILDVPASVAFDVSENGNRAAARNTVIYDATKPRGSIGSVSSSIAKSSSTVSIPFVLTDEKALGAISLDSTKVSLSSSSGVSCSSIEVTNPTSENPVVNLSQCSGDGTLTVSLLEGVAFDLAGNFTEVIASASFVVDNTVPSVSISSATASGAYTKSGTHTFIFDFSESVTGFTSADIVVANAAKGAFTAVSATQYTLAVTPSSEGSFTVDVPASAAVDSAGNPNSAAAQYTLIYDITAPTASLSSRSAAYAKNGDSAVTYTVTFADDRSLASTQLSLSDVSLNTTGGASCTAAISGSGSTRTVSLTSCTGNGSVAISLAAGTATDSAGNSAIAVGPSVGFTVDNTVPGISISSPSASLAKNGETVSFTVTYSDTYLSTINLLASHVTVNTSGTASCSGKTIVDGTSSTPGVQLSGCTGDGTISITVSAAHAIDLAGNSDAGAGPSSSFTVDNTGPSSHSVSIDSGATYTSSTSVTLTLAASDTNGVTQMFVSNSDTFASGSWEAFATSKAWTLAQTNATATVYVKFKDTVGNESTGVSDTIIHDNTGPSSHSVSIERHILRQRV